MPSPLLAHRGSFVQNLLGIYAQATPFDIAAGREWYPSAHEKVCSWAQLYDRTVANVATTVAVLSPQTEWSRNLQVAMEMLEHGYPQTPGALGTSVVKAQRVLEEKLEDTRQVMPGGPKVRAFSQNLCGDYTVATVDQHMIEACWNDPTFNKFPKPAGYAAYADAIVMAADEAGEDTATFQAIVWMTWKRLHPAGRKRHARRQAGIYRRAA